MISNYRTRERDTNPSSLDLKQRYAIVDRTIREQGQYGAEYLSSSASVIQEIAQQPASYSNSEELCYHPAQLAKKFNEAQKIYKLPEDMEISGTTTAHSFQVIAKSFENYVDEIERLVDIEPVANGYSHPIEKILERFFNESTDTIEKMLSNIIRSDEKSSLAAAILKCLSRIESESAKVVGLKLARLALKQNDAGVRDAAVQSLESWGGRDAVIILKQHRETVPWLKEYIDGVIEDIISEE